MATQRRGAGLLACVAMTVGLTAGCGDADKPEVGNGPEISTGYRAGMAAVRTEHYVVTTANPFATDTASAVLRDGGTAADAVIAAQATLGLVEPQSSGLGGGAFLLYYDAASKTLQAYDARETAPKAATENDLRWVNDQDRRSPLPAVRTSGRSIGVPGVPRLLEVVHREHGRAAWRTLFDRSIALADNGVRISPRLAQQIAASAADLTYDPATRAYFLRPDGSPKGEGEILTNPAMAKTLGALATGGADAFYRGAIARDIVDAVNSTEGARTPGRMTTGDLEEYRVVPRAPLCVDYRGRRVCGMPPPSSGGITVAATLGILSHFDLRALPPDNLDANGGRPKAEAVHLISEAERLAYADRDRYIADTDFVPLPGDPHHTLLDPAYLQRRAALIDPNRSMGTARAGEFPPAPGVGPPPPEHGTSHITVADRYGNVAAMTTTIEHAFGSAHMVGGFLLNNQLTDFSADPVGTDGVPVANRLQPGKRPRSSMAPTIVFADGAPQFALGSPGGSTIIQYVLKTLVALLDWNLDPQQAVGAVNFGAANTPVTNLGGEHPAIHPNDPLAQRLRAMGHTLSLAPQPSGASALHRTPPGWTGGADPRREGTASGG